MKCIAIITGHDFSLERTTRQGKLWNAVSCIGKSEAHSFLLELRKILLPNVRMSSTASLFHQSSDMFLPPPVVQTLNHVLIGDKKTGWYVDGWSAMHVMSGILVGLLLRGVYGGFTFTVFVIALVLHTLWELWQVWVGTHYIQGFDLALNSHDALVDTAFFMLGVWMMAV